MGRIAAGRDRAIKRLSRLPLLLLFHVKFTKFLVVSRRGIIQNLGFECLNAGPSAKSMDHSVKQRYVRQHFRDNVHTGAEKPAQENDVEPVVLRAPPEEVDDRKDLHDEAPRIEEVV